jgi:hypothetical protein
MATPIRVAFMTTPEIAHRIEAAATADKRSTSNYLHNLLDQHFAHVDDHVVTPFGEGSCTLPSADD